MEWQSERLRLLPFVIQDSYNLIEDTSSADVVVITAECCAQFALNCTDDAREGFRLNFFLRLTVLPGISKGLSGQSLTLLLVLVIKPGKLALRIRLKRVISAKLGSLIVRTVLFGVVGVKLGWIVISMLL